MNRYMIADGRTGKQIECIAEHEGAALDQFMQAGYAPDEDGITAERLPRTTLIIWDERHGLTATCQRDESIKGRGRRYIVEIYDGKSVEYMKMDRTLLKQVLRSGAKITARI